MAAVAVVQKSGRANILFSLRLPLLYWKWRSRKKHTSEIDVLVCKRCARRARQKTCISISKNYKMQSFANILYSEGPVALCVSILKKP
jgi:hypothetical protein